MFRTPGARFVPVATLLVIAGCESSTGARSRPCATMDVIEICADRSQYRPGAVISLTIANRRTATVYKDSCSTEVVGKMSRAASFEEDYDPTLFCGEDVTPADIAAAMVELAPGVSIVETYPIGRFAFQGFYRVNV